MKNQGEGDLTAGLANLGAHIRILRAFELPIVVAINRFPSDTDAELAVLQDYCAAQGLPSAFSEAFAKGAEGSVELARAVVKLVEEHPDAPVAPVYDAGDALQEKIAKVATKVYGAAAVSYSDEALEQLERFTSWGFGGLPICIAKTQYSLSDNAKLPGAPAEWTLHITNVALSAGAGFLVVIAGNMMLMPGLPKVSRGERIDVDADGEIVGLT